MPLPNILCFVDTETTGGSIRYDRVIEVGVVRIENNKVAKTFQSLLDPQKYLPEEITLLTGIKPKDLEEAPTFRQIKDDFLDIMDGALMVAHNVRFDYAFLKHEFHLLGQDFSPQHFCTLKLSKTLFPQFHHHSLDSLINRFSLTIGNRHRALDDALVLWQLYQKLLQEFGEEVLTLAIDKTRKRPSLPLKISQDQLDSLPQTCGVYIFYGHNGMPLYVGKSVNIRNRILSHFSADYCSPTEMKISQQVESIETLLTSGELGALFLEAALIKKLQPLYNRKLRHSRKLITLRSKTNEQDYQTLYWENLDTPNLVDTDSVLGLFKSKKDLKNTLLTLSKEFRLCHKLIGLEKTKGECFLSRLGKCQGACCGKEKADSYNIRFNLAFSKTRLKRWPFKGAIAIKEEDELGERGEAYVFDNWIYWGKINFSQFDHFWKLEKDLKFDLDTYKILEKFLRFDKKANIVPFDLKILSS